jgi:oligoendopeptidase F
MTQETAARTETVPPRSEIPHEHTWNVESVFASDAEWESAIGESKQLIGQIAKYRGQLANGPDTLSEATSILEKLLLTVGPVYLYGAMNRDADTEDQAAAAQFDRAQALLGDAFAAISFLEPELIAIGFDTLRAWLRDDSRLAYLGHYVDRLESGSKHVRSAEVEQVLAMAMNAFQTARGTHGVLADADLRFTPATSSNGDHIDITQGNIDALLTDSDREVRRTAFENYADAHLAFKNTMASCLSTGIKQDVFTARVRGYESSLHAALAPDHIPPTVFHSLIDTFKRHLPTWHKYWKLRRESLGYDKFHVYDIKAPMILSSPDVPFEESVNWICAGMEPLGSEYVETMRRGALDERWVDIYPNIGKRAGAYSAGWQGTYPFILMSYTDDVFSMSTLAHELGHSMHSLNTWKTQPYVYANYSTFVAEVASNFNQALVRHYLFEHNPDVDFQIALIDEAMSNFHRYFFIMPTLARFELELHERVERDEPLTAEVMNSIMADLFHEGYGDEVEFDADRIGITWAEFPTHLYMNFYVFQYATGIAAAHALVQRVLEQGEPAAAKYLDFLRAGSSQYPIDALMSAGVDMNSPEPVEAAFRYLDDMVERLAVLLKQPTSA